jgi:surfeit locus 1 family protein
VRLYFANRRFSPSVFATALAVAGIALFMRLGFWQLHRAEEKQALLTQYSVGAQSTMELSATSVSSLPTFQHVYTRGHFDPAHQLLLDNMPSQHGQAGYRVVTPFELEQGGWILVDRGWIQMGATRQALPDVSVGSELRNIAGRFDALPRAGIDLANPAVDRSAPWPRVMSFPQHDPVEGALGHRLLPGLILLDADQPNGYERVWQAHFSFGPERHIAYAVQWFAFAVAAAIVYVIVSLRRESDEPSADPSRT